MGNTCLLDHIPELKEKFDAQHGHKKKLRALENYSQVADFHHNDYLTLIKSCMQAGFLDRIEEEFLSHMLDKYGLNFLDWSHRTKWLKEEIQKMPPKTKQPQYVQKTFFDMHKADLPTIPQIPFEVLMQNQKQNISKKIAC